MDIADLEAQLAALGAGPDHRVARIDAQLALAWAIRFTERPRAYALSLEARELARAEGYTLGRARAARVLSMTTAASNGIRELVAHAEEAKVLFDEAGDRAGSAASRDYLSSLYEYIGDLSIAMELAQEALAIAREIEDPVRQGYALSSVGGILASTGDVTAAFTHLDEALRLFEGIDDGDGIRRICSRLTKLCRQTGQLDEALSHAQRLLEMSQHADLSVDHATALAALAELAEDMGNPVEAERLYRASLAAFPEQEVRAVIGGPIQVKLGRLLTERQALDEAHGELTEALERITWIDASPADEAEARRALADVCERRGDTTGALHQLREVIRLTERAAQAETRSQLTQVEARAEMRAAKQEAEIHRLKFVELSQMQAQLVESERMAQLGKLAAGTAHELNTPLGVLRSNLDVYARAVPRLLASQGPGQEAQRERIAQALSACAETSAEALARIATVADTLKRFTQLDLPEQRRFDPVESVQSAIALLRPSCPAGVRVETRFEPVPAMEGWPGQLNQAFMTVLQNAVQALEGEGTVTAEVGLAEGRIQVRIRDTGRGMDEAERNHIFEVGWSASGARTKMRLGLSAVQSTVQRHGGQVHVDSAPGLGTTFTFSFPPSAPPPSSESVPERTKG